MTVFQEAQFLGSVGTASKRVRGSLGDVAGNTCPGLRSRDDGTCLIP